MIFWTCDIKFSIFRFTDFRFHDFHIFRFSVFRFSYFRFENVIFENFEIFENLRFSFIFFWKFSDFWFFLHYIFFFISIEKIFWGAFSKKNVLSTPSCPKLYFPFFQDFEFPKIFLSSNPFSWHIFVTDTTHRTHIYLFNI